jgi:molybdate transport system substrate-binding protein
LYRPIQQQAVLLKENDAARSFLGFVGSPQARKLIKEFGYDLP